MMAHVLSVLAVFDAFPHVNHLMWLVIKLLFEGSGAQAKTSQETGVSKLQPQLLMIHGQKLNEYFLRLVKHQPPADFPDTWKDSAPKPEGNASIMEIAIIATFAPCGNSD